MAINNPSTNTIYHGMWNSATNSIVHGIDTAGAGSGPTPPANGYVAEDGTTYYVAANGTTYYVQES